MAIRTHGDLHMCPTMDRRQIKIIDAEYNVRVGYLALKNNMKEYKVYVIMICMFDIDFVNNL